MQGQKQNSNCNSRFGNSGSSVEYASINEENVSSIDSCVVISTSANAYLADFFANQQQTDFCLKLWSQNSSIFLFICGWVYLSQKALKTSIWFLNVTFLVSWQINFGTDIIIVDDEWTQYLQMQQNVQLCSISVCVRKVIEGY